MKTMLTVLTVEDIQKGEVCSELLLRTLAQDTKRVKAIKEELSLRIRQVDGEVNRVLTDCVKEVLGERARSMPYVRYRASVNQEGFVDVVCNLAPRRLTKNEATRIENDALEALVTVCMLPEDMIHVRISGSLLKARTG